MSVCLKTNMTPPSSPAPLPPSLPTQFFSNISFPCLYSVSRKFGPIWSRGWLWAAKWHVAQPTPIQFRFLTFFGDDVELSDGLGRTHEVSTVLYHSIFASERSRNSAAGPCWCHITPTSLSLSSSSQTFHNPNQSLYHPSKPPSIPSNHLHLLPSTSSFSAASCPASPQAQLSAQPFPGFWFGFFGLRQSL